MMALRLRLTALVALGLGVAAAAKSAADTGAAVTANKPRLAKADSAARVETRFAQVDPVPKQESAFQRSQGQTRAIILLHGLRLHPLSNESVNRAVLRDWQKPGSTLVRTLARHADLFAFAYSQNVPVDQIADRGGLDVDIWRLKEMGYTEIALVAHSAGGLIAREFVEDHPKAGVTKVIQVCAPNAGSSCARVETGVCKNQRAFLASLTKEVRAACLAKRASKRIPDTVQFVCIVGDGAGAGDGLVSNASQWPKDLQEQGIPALGLRTTHFTVMRNKKDAEKIAALVCERQPRWDASKVAAARRELLKD